MAPSSPPAAAAGCPGCPADSFAGGGRLSLETVTPCTTSFTPSLRAVRAAQAISCLWRALSELWVAAGRREEGDGVMLFWPCAMSERAQCRSARPGHCESACWAVHAASVRMEEVSTAGARAGHHQRLEPLPARSGQRRREPRTPRGHLESFFLLHPLNSEIRAWDDVSTPNSDWSL